KQERGYTKNLQELLQVIPLALVRSASLAKKLEALGCPPEKIRLNRTGIPTEEFPIVTRDFPKDGKWKIVQTCRLIEKKGLPAALCAFARFQNKYPEARFFIAGEGPLEQSLRDISEGLKIKSSVEFLGFQDQQALRSLYEGAHIFLHPSQVTAAEDQEGVPNAMLEAMATGLPVVATKHGGIPEAVKDGVEGILKNEGDDAGLAQAMVQLATNEELWRKMGATAAESVRENFSTQGQITNLEACYRELQSLAQR
ncbi:MAG: glycosyltransferase, partial [Chthoniobacterales bacterium]